jgi:tyrosyl-tRNA synthetase
VRRFLGFFTTLAMEEVDALTRDGGAALNRAKEVLGYEVTRLVHGQDEADRARAAAQAAFGAGHDVTGDAIPHAVLPAAELAAGIGIMQLVVRAGLAPSTSEAKRLIQGGGVALGGDKVADFRRVVGSADACDGRLVLQAGKKRFFRFDLG